MSLIMAPMSSMTGLPLNSKADERNTQLELTIKQMERETRRS